jgi:hypothetical protein
MYDRGGSCHVIWGNTMFAILGLGIAEIIVLAIIALLMVGVPIIIIRSVNASSQSTGAGRKDEIAELRKEVRWLSEEFERLKQEIGRKGPADGIKSDT